MNRFIHFEIPARDIENASRFYSRVFGWKIEKWEGPVDYYLITTGDESAPGINGGFYTPEEGIAGTINTMNVDDLDAMLAKVVDHGGKVALPKHLLPGVGSLAYVMDPEGNLMGLLQPEMD